ncbi:Protein of unknown function [Pyronema omphalodes CBS 100304]|uniref:Uncharacterized protein n=1 Tax=Pyronema omphalodes (strain CBS 100304) TaxID=1076935 RepID=U4LKQ9_PYROM|nr:Protein of unknown function [Pyronema omphalodes CBS 100304]
MVPSFLRGSFFFWNPRVGTQGHRWQPRKF